MDPPIWSNSSIFTVSPPWFLTALGLVIDISSTPPYICSPCRHLRATSASFFSSSSMKQEWLSLMVILETSPYWQQILNNLPQWTKSFGLFISSKTRISSSLCNSDPMSECRSDPDEIQWIHKRGYKGDKYLVRSPGQSSSSSSTCHQSQLQIQQSLAEACRRNWW